jgi:tetratricopeptide (TPR) repeat protein
MQAPFQIRGVSVARSNHYLRLAFLLSVGAALCGCGSAYQRETDYIQHGRHYFAAGDYQKARVEFSNAAQIDPKNHEVHFLLGEVAEKLGDVRGAAGQYQAAVQEDPKDSAARAALGRLYLLAGLPDKAMELAAPGLAADPKDAELLTVRGAARAQLGDAAQALKDAQRAVTLAPRDPYAVALLASIYRNDSQFDKAIAVVHTALAQLPKSVDLRVMLADLYTRAKRPRLAESELKRVIALEPDVLVNRYRLARFYVLQKDDVAAEQTLRAAVAAAPKSVEARVQLVGFVLAQKGKTAAAAEIDRQTAADPQDDALKLAFGKLIARGGMTDQAESLLRAVIESAGTEPDGLEARDQLASLLLAHRDAAGASTLIDAVLKVAPRDDEALILRADISMSSGNVSGAIDDLRAVLRDQPNAVPVMRTLAGAYVRNGELGQAEATLRTAMQIAPKDGDTRLQLAEVLADENKLDQAASILEQLTKEVPVSLAAEQALVRVQMAQRRYGDAASSAEEIEKSDPKLALGYYLAGLADAAAGNTGPAAQAYQAALEREPDAAEPLIELVHLDLERRQPTRAIARIEAVLAKYPRNGVAWTLKGQVLANGGHLAQAIAADEQAVEVAPTWPSGYHDLALTQVVAKQPTAAIRTLQSGIARAHDSATLVMDLSALYRRLNRPQDAIALYQGLLAKDPRSTFAINNLAMLLATYRHDAASLALARKLAGELSSSTEPAAIDTRGWVAYQSGDYHGAESLLQDAVNRSPRSAELRYHLAMAELRSGEPDVARQNLEAALASNEPFDGADQARSALARLTKLTQAH